MYNKIAIVGDYPLYKRLLYSAPVGYTTSNGGDSFTLLTSKTTVDFYAAYEFDKFRGTVYDTVILSKGLQDFDQWKMQAQASMIWGGNIYES
jgi:hypothetical protein